LLLTRAGLKLKPRTYYLYSAAAGLLAGQIVLVTGSSPIVALLAAFAVGIGLPRWILFRTIKRRQAKFLQEFANAIDIIIRGVKSGLPLGECLQIIGNEAPEPVQANSSLWSRGRGLGCRWSAPSSACTSACRFRK
jgi:tight adherence protein B